MKTHQLILLFSLICFGSYAQFAPPVGQNGTTAIYKDSSVFVSWATGCSVIRGFQDISNTTLGYASAGDSSMVIGFAGSNGVVSMGDGGSAIVTFANPIYNGAGWDFAIFENTFNDTFLELAFVEVSSDGINYYRFAATSNTQDTLQVGSFGSVDATQINNLAGKYRALYGTPFDLQELINHPGLDVNNITHIKIIDVVGCIQEAFATYDSNGHKVNDPWNTPFISSGFDLDAVGVIHQVVTSVPENFTTISQLHIFPNPVNENSVVHFYLDKTTNLQIEISDITGRIVFKVANEQQLQGWQSLKLNSANLISGIYFITLQNGNEKTTMKFII